MYVQTALITEFPQCIFMDAELAFTTYLKPELADEMKNSSLNEYCRVYGTEFKNSMSYEVMNEHFISNDADMTDIFKYAIQDTVVLHQIYIKSSYMKISCAMA